LVENKYLIFYLRIELFNNSTIFATDITVFLRQISRIVQMDVLPAEEIFLNLKYYQ